MIVGSRSAIAIAPCALLLGACSSGVPLIGGGATEINAEDFAAPAGSPRPQTVRAQDATPDAPAEERALTAAEAAAPTALQEGTGLIDAKVGDLNGRPIFAAQWLAPLSGRLRADAARMSPQEWRNSTSGIIAQRLKNELIDELLFTEARRSLTEVQQAGLRYVLAEIQQTQIRRAGGSRTAAERALAEANNQTLDEFVRDEERRLLVAEELRKQIDDKVQVPWREIKLAYQRNADVFDPPPVATFRQIRVRTDREERMAEVRNALASGTPFAEVADLEVNETPDPIERTVSRDPDTPELEYSANQAINELALSLAPGQWGGPVEGGNRTYWVYLAEVRHDFVTLYDAQLDIERQLRAEQREEALSRYLGRRVSRAGLEEFDRMVIDLTEIAAKWYYYPYAEPEPESEQ